jgi:hypothetical protein
MPGCAFLVLIDERKGDEFGEGGVGGGGEVHLLPLRVFADELEGVVGLGVEEGMHSEGEEVGDASRGPDVAFVGVGLILELFGGGVEEGALVEGEVVHP